MNYTKNSYISFMLWKYFVKNLATLKVQWYKQNVGDLLGKKRNIIDQKFNINQTWKRFLNPLCTLKSSKLTTKEINIKTPMTQIQMRSLSNNYL